MAADSKVVNHEVSTCKYCEFNVFTKNPIDGGYPFCYFTKNLCADNYRERGFDPDVPETFPVTLITTPVPLTESVLFVG